MRRTCWLSAGWATCNWLAAFEKEPLSTTFEKYRSCRRSIGLTGKRLSIPPQAGRVVIELSYTASGADCHNRLGAPNGAQAFRLDGRAGIATVNALILLPNCSTGMRPRACEGEGPLDIRQLQIFAAVSEAGNLSKAALTLAVTQPMITRHIRALEEELGVELFYRNGRGVVMTEAGQLLKTHADEILCRVSHARTEVGSLLTSPRGKLVLGVPPSVGTVLTVPLVKKIKNEFPNITLQVIEGFSGHVLEWLTSGRIDAAVLYGSPNHPSVLSEPLVEDELFLIAPARSMHDLPDGPLELDWFATLPMILPSRPHGLRRLIDGVLTDAGIHPRIEMELEAMPSTLLLVEDGAGYTILPYASVHPLVQAGRVRVRSFRPAITRMLHLATSSQRPMSSVIRTLIRTVRNEVRDVISTYPWKPVQEGD